MKMPHDLEIVESSNKQGNHVEVTASNQPLEFVICDPSRIKSKGRLK